MKKNILVLLGVAAISFWAVDVYARGGGGGGRGGGGGGGGGRVGGGGGGGFSGGGGARPMPSPARSMPSPAMNHGPSMSRAAPSPGMNRPSTPMAGPRPTPGGSGFAGAGGRTQVGGGPAGGFGGGGGGAGGFAGAGAGGKNAFQSPSSFQHPNQGQLNSFLNMPQQGAAGGRSPGSPSSNAFSSGGGDGFQSKSYTTPGGSTITVGGGKGSTTTPGGATIGGAAGGVKIEGAGGNTVVKGSGAVGASKGDSAVIAGGSRAGIETASGAGAVRGTSTRAATDGTNSAIRSGSATAARDAAGNSIANVRGGYADSSGYRQGGSLTAARNQWGYTGASARGGFGANGTGQVGAIAGIRGPGGNVVSAGRGSAYVNGQFVGGKAWGAVNGAYTRWGAFTPGWYGGYPGAWWPGKWAIAATAWSAATWGSTGSYCGCEGEGAYYDYGENVTYDDGTVYYGDQPVATAEQYYDQAGQIAASGAESQNEEWMPLGVFAVITEPTQTQTDKTVQLALNKEGSIRGNLHDFVTDKVSQVTGAVDKSTQRVAFKVDGVDNLIVETGLYNLTNDEVPVMLHLGADRQESRTLIRLQQPEDKAKGQ